MLTNKCLQFQLPSGGGGMPAQMNAGRIRGQLNRLVYEKKISQYEITHEKHYKMNVWFKDEVSYTVVMLLWDEPTIYKQPVIVEKPVEENPYYGK